LQGNAPAAGADPAPASRAPARQHEEEQIGRAAVLADEPVAAGEALLDEVEQPARLGRGDVLDLAAATGGTRAFGLLQT
jgi:hypothetical protein